MSKTKSSYPLNVQGEKKTEWEFEPTLEIEPELNEDEVLDILAKLCQPVQEPSDPEKKETSA